LPSKTTLGQILENTASQNIYVGTHFYLTAKRDVHVVSVNRLWICMQGQSLGCC